MSIEDRVAKREQSRSRKASQEVEAYLSRLVKVVDEIQDAVKKTDVARASLSKIQEEARTALHADSDRFRGFSQDVENLQGALKQLEEGSERLGAAYGGVFSRVYRYGLNK